MFEMENDYFLMNKYFEISTFDLIGLLGITTIEVVFDRSIIKNADSEFYNLTITTVGDLLLGIKEWTFKSEEYTNSSKLKFNNVS